MLPTVILLVDLGDLFKQSLLFRKLSKKGTDRSSFGSNDIDRPECGEGELDISHGYDY